MSKGAAICGLAATLGMYLAAEVQAGDAQQIASTVCAACHGADGNSTDPAVPKIAGMDAAYLRKQLSAFSNGLRRSELMTPIAASISEDDRVALAKHFNGKKASKGVVHDAPLAEAGRQIYEDGNSDTGVPACSVCHQPDGSGNARFPRVAGQHQTYTLTQMADFKSGRRSTDRLMVTVAQRLSALEMKALAEYMASLPTGAEK